MLSPLPESVNDMFLTTTASTGRCLILVIVTVRQWAQIISLKGMDRH